MNQSSVFRSAMNTPNEGSHVPFGGPTPTGFKSSFDQRRNGRVPAMMRNMPAIVRPRQIFGSDPVGEFKSCIE